MENTFDFKGNLRTIIVFLIIVFGQATSCKNHSECLLQSYTESPLECEVLRGKGCESALEETDHHGKDLHPYLASIGIYFVDPILDFEALNFSFEVPETDVLRHDISEVIVSFVTDEPNHDDGYNDDYDYPICHHFKLGTTSKLPHNDIVTNSKVQVVYSCIGLYIYADDFRLSLMALPSRQSLNYIIRWLPYHDYTDNPVWQSLLVGLAVVEGLGVIHVLFEPVAPKADVTYVVVELQRENVVVSKKLVPKGQHSVKFEDVSGGYYRVKLSPTGPACRSHHMTCTSYQSATVWVNDTTTRSVKRIIVTDPKSWNVSGFALVCAVVGVSSLLILLVSCVLYLWRRLQQFSVIWRPSKKKAVWIISLSSRKLEGLLAKYFYELVKERFSKTDVLLFLPWAHPSVENDPTSARDRDVFFSIQDKIARCDCMIILSGADKFSGHGPDGGEPGARLKSMLQKVDTRYTALVVFDFSYSPYVSQTLDIPALSISSESVAGLGRELRRPSHHGSLVCRTDNSEVSNPLLDGIENQYLLPRDREQFCKFLVSHFSSKSSQNLELLATVGSGKWDIIFSLAWKVNENAEQGELLFENDVITIYSDNEHFTTGARQEESSKYFPQLKKFMLPYRLHDGPNACFSPGEFQETCKEREDANIQSSDSDNGRGDMTSIEQQIKLDLLQNSNSSGYESNCEYFSQPYIHQDTRFEGSGNAACSVAPQQEEREKVPHDFATSIFPPREIHCDSDSDDWA
ncbi:uncharacterized protein LOC106011117 [Aplysia californica]|uniref:Uncharacterized protein LOC106011117 n=1 Tax=Aplysia californica TaxID=6500 RepID=A0ABM0ZV29_APLCA|nr:uncharacterized protein LOC106011117 [Aplysia californica]